MAVRGFSLIEIMLAILLASLLSLSLFQLLNQTRRVVRRIVNVIEVDEPLAAFYTQVEKDVTGMFSPQSSIEAYAQEDKKAEAAKKAPQNTKGPEQKTEVPKEAPKEGPKEEAITPIRPVMVFDMSKDTGCWSFITTGGIVQLDAKGAVDPAAFVRRVAYVLERDPQRPHLRRLMYRYSKDKLQGAELQCAGCAVSYELLPGIKDIAFEFTLIEVIEKKPGVSSEAASTAPTTSVLKEWNEAEIWKKFKALIPAYVKMSGTVEDAVGKEYPFELFMKVPAYAPYKPKEETLAQRLERIASDIFGKKP